MPTPPPDPTARKWHASVGLGGWWVVETESERTGRCRVVDADEKQLWPGDASVFVRYAVTAQDRNGHRGEHGADDGGLGCLGDVLCFSHDQAQHLGQGIDGKGRWWCLNGQLHGGNGEEVGNAPFKYGAHKFTTPLHRQRRSRAVGKQSAVFFTFHRRPAAQCCWGDVTFRP